MQLIRSGGVNTTYTKKDPNYATHGFGNYFMVQIRSTIDALLSEDKEIAICVAAMPDKHHFDARFDEMGFDRKRFTILGKDDDADWERYAGILILGGNTRELHSWLMKANFNIKLLHKCELLAGDSAGAHLLSGKALIDYTADGHSIEIIDGLIPQLPQLIVSHTNNPYYYSPRLASKLKLVCHENNYEFIELDENQATHSVLSF